MKHETNFNAKRRQVLKTSAGISAICTAGWASSALSFSNDSPNNMAVNKAGSVLPCCDLTIYQHQSKADKTVTILNNTSTPITIDEFSLQDLALKQGSMSLNVTSVQTPITLRPNESVSFMIEAHTANAGWNLGDQPVPNVIAGKIGVKSSHAEFNGLIPVTVFDAVHV